MSPRDATPVLAAVLDNDRYDCFGVPVVGGVLHAGRWTGDPDAPVVVAAHGITGSHVAWAEVAAALAGAVTLVAPDLRGRGSSNRLPGPFGMGAHARDLVAVIDHLGLDRAVLAGHSMGGYVATVAGMLAPERVAGVVLVDGGIAPDLPPPPDLDVDAVLDAVIGPAIARLRRTFESREQYHAFWRAHPAVGPWWSPTIEAYVDYDLEGEPPVLRSRSSLDAVRADSEDTLVVPDARVAAGKLACPSVLLRAQRGMLDDPLPLLTDELVAAVRIQAPNLGPDEVVARTNHYTIVLAPTGAAAVARAIAEMAGAER